MGHEARWNYFKIVEEFPKPYKYIETSLAFIYCASIVESTAEVCLMFIRITVSPSSINNKLEMNFLESSLN